MDATTAFLDHGEQSGPEPEQLNVDWVRVPQIHPIVSSNSKPDPSNCPTLAALDVEVDKKL
jgi:hypothetical protein